ncbi:MAG: CopY family transcriptional regulator [Verrucomicrobiales bacterium]|nr:CopY family transcriptional regulator [Verrucomicrobiales bacterium]
MSKEKPAETLTRRERQIMDILYASGQASAKEIEEKLPDAPTGATVRTILRVLLEKGHVRHRQEGRAFIYEPKAAPAKAAQSAARRLLDVFFQGSLERAVSGLLDARDSTSEAELARLETLIREARAKSPKQP